MKKLLFLLFLIPAAVSALTYSDGGGGADSGVFNTLKIAGSGNDVTAATTSFTGTITGEQRGFLWDTTYTGTGTTDLPSGIWSFMHYNQSGAITTAHGGAIFGRVIMATTARGFGFGVEGNCWNNSVQTGGVSTTGACVGVIGHSIWEGAAASTPTVPTIGGDFRAEFTDPTITTNRFAANLADMIAVRTEVYQASTSTWDSRSYNLYGAVGGSDPGKIVNNGPIMAIPPAAQTIASGGFILSDGCGGVKQITAGSAVATDATNTFSLPSISTTGTANTGCVMTVVNSGANTITLKNNATTLTYGGIDVSLPSAGAVIFVSNGGNWIQSSRVVVTTLAGVYLSSVTAVANTAATTVWGNQGTVTLLPGEWDINGVCDISLNGSVTTAVSMALSAFTGNTTTDQVSGDNQLTLLPPTAAADVSTSIAGWRQAVASSTAVFVKVKATFSAGSPQAACRISARRIN